MDAAEVKERQRRLWGQGDYPAVAARFQAAADALVAAAGVGPGHEVLDVAAGTGNVAVAAARTGARRVVASDLTPELIALGEARTEAEGLAVEWVEADAEALPFGEASFDLALSAFGVIFAPRPEVAAAELERVVRPGGRVGIAAWEPDGLNGRIGAAFERYLPRPADGPSMPEWGREDVLRERLGDGVRLSRGAVPWDFSSEEEALTFMERSVPPIALARTTLPPEVYARLRDELRAALREFDEGDGEDVRAPAAYVLAVVARD